MKTMLYFGLCSLAGGLVAALISAFGTPMAWLLLLALAGGVILHGSIRGGEHGR